MVQAVPHGYPYPVTYHAQSWCATTTFNQARTLMCQHDSESCMCDECMCGPCQREMVQHNTIEIGTAASIFEDGDHLAQHTPGG